MTVHVLHAGDGYTYLTRQVATGDVPLQRGSDLSAYYAASGNPPGRWVGEGLDSLGVDGQVSEAQMKALFGEGRHPDADQIERALIVGGATPKQAMATTKLGRAYMRAQDTDDDGFTAALSAKHAEFRAEHDRDPLAGAEREGLRRDAARALLTARGKPAAPSDVGRFLAARGQAARQPVAGYDLVFTPVKSVSVLWGLGDEQVRQQVEAAHEDAWRGSLAWLETQAALTRVGAGGVAQVDTRGFVATAFDHLDSRSGDPNLHTHVAISNKVLGLDGKWRSLDGRVVHALGVAASERYNTLIETGLRARLGVQFADRQVSRTGRRPVREVEGIPTELTAEFSRRRESIDAAYEVLVGEYRARHGHEPPRHVQHKLAQRATLATRGGKETGVSLQARRAQWMPRAEAVLGSRQAVDDMVAASLNRPDRTPEPMPSAGQLVDQITTELMSTRATWKYQHVLAEAQRVARTYVDHVGPDAVQALAEALTDQTSRASIQLTPPEPNPAPAALRRVDATSVYVQHAGAKYTANPILDAEDRLLASARRDGGIVVPDQVVTEQIAAAEAQAAHALSRGQADMVREFATSGKLLQVAIGPAGAGKTTAMRVFTQSVEAAGGKVVAVGPSSIAAQILGEEIGAQGYSLHAFLSRNGLDPEDAKLLRGPFPENLPAGMIDSKTVILVDEAGMAATAHLDAVVRLAAHHGASVRAVGDWAQLQAVGAGGALRLIDQQVGGPQLVDVHRFVTPGEGEASLALRDGDASVIDRFYAAHGRLSGGTSEAMTEEMYAHWWADQQAGRDAVMIAQSNTDVTALAARARVDRVAAGQVEAHGVRLHDENTAGVGDRIVTRRNDPDLKMRNGTDFVRNGQTWTVLAVREDGSLRVRADGHGATADLPAAYVGADVDLAYAATVHRTQGMTVDAAYVLVSDRMGRDGLYAGMTRGRQTNRAFVVTENLLDVDPHPDGAPARAIRQAMASAMNASDDTPSATATLAAEAERVVSLATTHPAYEDAIARVLDPDREERLTRAVRAALPPAAATSILEDGAWPTLRDLLAAHERAGADVPSLIAGKVAEREIGTAESLARVVWWRVGDPDLPESTDPRLPTWITPVPTEVDAGPDSVDVANWVAAQREVMAERLDQLVARTAEHPPTWAAQLRAAPPVEAPERADWEQDMRAILAYRDRWDGPDSDPLPATEPKGIEKSAYGLAARAASRLAAEGPNPEAGAKTERAALNQQTELAREQTRTRTQIEPYAAAPEPHPGVASSEERRAALQAARAGSKNPSLDEMRSRLRALTKDPDGDSRSEMTRSLAERATAIAHKHAEQRTAQRAPDDDLAPRRSDRQL